MLINKEGQASLPNMKPRFYSDDSTKYVTQMHHFSFLN